MHCKTYGENTVMDTGYVHWNDNKGKVTEIAPCQVILCCNSSAQCGSIFSQGISTQPTFFFRKMAKCDKVRTTYTVVLLEGGLSDVSKTWTAIL